MPKLHYVDQYSEAYDALRRGIPTSSKFDCVITPEGKPSKQWQKYAFHLLAERILGRSINTYTSPAMEYGLEMEPEAVSWYENIHCDGKVEAQRIGFVTTDDGKIGCSPDRLVGEEGLIEVKCPQPQTQVEYLLTGHVDQRYKPQLQGQLFVTGRKWVDIVAWNPELPRVVIRVERDEAFIACLDKLLKDFVTYCDTVMEKLADTVSPPTEKGLFDERQEIQF